MGLDDGDNFQGIVPPMLAQLTKSLSSGVNGAEPVASSYVSRLSRLGLDTGTAQKLLADYAWASSQQSMLQRRYSLASHQPSGDFTDGWTSAGAGALLYPTTAAAKKAGTADAQQMRVYLDSRDWTGIQKELNAMSQNSGDADYMAAFFSQLGPSGLYGLSLYAHGASGKGNEQQVQQVVGNGLATASYEMNLSSKFLQGIEPEDPPAGYNTQEMPGGWDTSALAPFLTEGEFSKQWLQTISPAVLYQSGNVEMGQQIPPGYDQIFSAIASNPDYAAQFFQQNSQQLNQYMTEPELYHYLANGHGFGQFLEAATIPPSGATSTRAFTVNATAFVRLFGDADSPIDTSSSVRQAMAAVTGNYFNDVVGTVTAAAPGAGSTMNLTAAEWGMFVQSAMEDKTAAAYLMTSYANWRAPQLKNPDDLATSGAGDGPDTPLHAGYWNDQSLGALDYFFASNYQAAHAKAGEGSSITDTLMEALDAGGATLLTSVVFGPEAGGAELLLDAGKDAFSSGTESALGKLTESFAENGDKGPGADGLTGDLTSAQARWSQAVNSAWTASGSKPGQVNKTDFKPRDYNGVPYDADPLPYEQQYGGNFMDADGTIKPLDEIQKDPKALAAYNAWLQDPAVSYVVAGEFSAESQGIFQGVASAALGGSGG